MPFESCDASGASCHSKTVAGLAEIIRACRPDLLHANSLAMGRLSGPVAREIGVPSLSHLRDIVVLRRQAIADLNCHHRLLAVSEATRRFHVAQGLTAERTSVLYNGVDTGLFRPASPSGYLHDELGLPRDCPLIATIGQISLRKGLDAVLMALAELGDCLNFGHRAAWSQQKWDCPLCRGQQCDRDICVAGYWPAVLGEG